MLRGAQGTRAGSAKDPTRAEAGATQYTAHRSGRTSFSWGSAAGSRRQSTEGRGTRRSSPPMFYRSVFPCFSPLKVAPCPANSVAGPPRERWFRSAPRRFSRSQRPARVQGAAPASPAAGGTPLESALGGFPGRTDFPRVCESRLSHPTPARQKSLKMGVSTAVNTVRCEYNPKSFHRLRPAAASLLAHRSGSSAGERQRCAATFSAFRPRGLFDLRAERRGVQRQ